MRPTRRSRVGSYLSIEDVVGAAAGADALHPGYGFLSENAALARACAEAGVVFVGPSPRAIELMGDKVRAKEAARAAGVPVVPDFTVDEARGVRRLSAAGQGRGGRRRARDARGGVARTGLDEAIAAAQREAKAGFGDDRVFIERFLPRARHIEVQVIGDAHGNVVLARRARVLAAAPPSEGARGVAVAGRLRRAARRAGRARPWRWREPRATSCAGTVEFIADADDPSTHYFLEMNARLQVEHPVTELVTGLDLVELQLRVAAGEPLDARRRDARAATRSRRA